MAISQDPKNSDIYTVAELWVDRCLRHDGSLFVDDRALWSKDNFQGLRHAFTEQSGGGEGTFLDRVAVQLQDADDDVVLLFAEVLAVHLLISKAVSGSRKRSIITAVLDMLDDPVEIPQAVDTALDDGIINPGVAYNAFRPYQLQLLIDVMIAFKTSAPERQDELLTNPWAFRELVFSIEHHAAYTQQLALLHLVHPTTFESIVSRKHKQAIWDAFADRIDEQDDVDRALAEIRAVLDAETGGMDSFYEPAIHQQWDPQRAEVYDQLARFAELYPNEHLTKDERKYKLKIRKAVREAMADPDADDWATAIVRPLTNNLVHHIGADQFKSFLTFNPALAVESLRRLLDKGEPLVDRVDDFSDTVHEHGQESIGRPGGHLAIIGALLLASDGDYAPYQITRVQQIYKLLGETSPSEVTVGERYQDWMQLLDEVQVELRAKGREVVDRLDVQGLLWQMVDVDPPQGADAAEVEAFEQWRAKRLGKDVGPGPTTEEPNSNGSDATPSVGLPELATKLHLSTSWLRRVHDLLLRNRQVIFYGPPGTGKTYVARELARHIAGDPEQGRVEIVQFHPSYSYEDFIEGFRPTVSDGSIGYSLEPGPLKILADAARQSDEPHVLLVDEINRANLPKVFGELLYLLEYRNEDIRLQYSHDRFSLPDNLFVVGTMNTADRSIALIDAALRRRFRFVPFFPHEGEIKGLLRRYLEGQERDTGLWVADALDGVNAELRELLGGPHLQVGPSHFMVKEEVELNLDRVEEIWEFSIHPYIEEQLFGREEQIAKFTFDEVRIRYGPDDASIDQAAETSASYEPSGTSSTNASGDLGDSEDGTDA